MQILLSSSALWLGLSMVLLRGAWPEICGIPPISHPVESLTLFVNIVTLVCLLLD